jgi:hypothetical protein
MADNLGGQEGRRLRGTILRLAACGLLLGGIAVAFPAISSADSSLSLVVNYATATSYQVTQGTGAAVASGSTIPAGTYTITVKDDPNTGDLNPLFTINGPGVSLANNLNSSGMGIDATSTFGPYTFQANATYTIEDTNLGSSTLVTVMTSASSSGTSTSPAATATAPASTTSGASASGGSSSSGSSGKGTSQSKGGSSTTSTTHGALEATITLSAKATLTLDGRAVKTLAPGTYTVKLVDHAKTTALVIGRSGHASISLAGSRGTSSYSVKLSSGRWYFSAGSKGKKTYFTVNA